MVVPVSQEGFKLSNRFDSSTVRCSMQTMNYDLAVRISTRLWRKRHDDRLGMRFSKMDTMATKVYQRKVPTQGQKLDSYA